MGKVREWRVEERDPGLEGAGNFGLERDAGLLLTHTHVCRVH